MISGGTVWIGTMCSCSSGFSAQKVATSFRVRVRVRVRVRL